MNTVGIVLIVILGLVLVLAIGVFTYLSCYVSLPKSGMESSRQFETEHGFWRGFDERRTVKYSIKSYDGYELHAEFVPNEAAPDPKKFVIISHGYTSTRYGSLKYFNKWMELGYNCVLYDDRRHGMNKKGFFNPSTLGIKESKDLIAVINDTYSRYGEDIYLGLHGESMGSALQITALKYNPKVHFIFNDCGFAEITNVLEAGICEVFKLPAWLIYPASVINRILFGWSFTKNRPIDSLKNNTVPICFVHGEDDTFIKCENSKMMAEANPAYTELHLVPGAEHAMSMFVDEAGYLEIMKAFLKKVYEMEGMQ